MAAGSRRKDRPLSGKNHMALEVTNNARVRIHYGDHSILCYS